MRVYGVYGGECQVKFLQISQVPFSLDGGSIVRVRDREAHGSTKRERERATLESTSQVVRDPRPVRSSTPRGGGRESDIERECMRERVCDRVCVCEREIRQSVGESEREQKT